MSAKNDDKVSIWGKSENHVNCVFPVHDVMIVLVQLNLIAQLVDSLLADISVG